jgi:hypothetical protein
MVHFIHEAKMSKSNVQVCSAYIAGQLVIESCCFFLMATLCLKHSDFRVITCLWNTQRILFCQVCCRFLHLWKYCIGVDGVRLELFQEVRTFVIDY